MAVNKNQWKPCGTMTFGKFFPAFKESWALQEIGKKMVSKPVLDRTRIELKNFIILNTKNAFTHLPLTDLRK